MSDVTVLLVEDDQRVADAIREDLEPACYVFVVSNRDAAFDRIRSGDYDILVCDLVIPPSEKSSELDESHGQMVWQRSTIANPGIPVLILSQYATDENVQYVQSKSSREDFFRTGSTQESIQIFPKTRLSDCIESVKHLLAAHELLDQIPVTWDGPYESKWRKYAERVARLHCRKAQGIKAVIKELPGGLSGSHVSSITVFDATSPVSVAVCKIDARGKIEQELRHHGSATSALPHGLVPSIIDSIQTNLGGLGALVMRSVGSRPLGLYEYAMEDPIGAVAVYDILKSALETWYGPPSQNITVDAYEYIESFTSTEHVTHAKELGLELDEIREIEVEVALSKQHGDLHGLNVLVTDDRKPVLIDYVWVEEYSVCYDAVVMELDSYFHSHSGIADAEWCEVAASRDWFDIESWTAGVGAPEFIEDCRSWAVHRSGGAHQLALTVLAHCVARMSHEDIPQKLAITIARRTIQVLKN